MEERSIYQDIAKRTDGNIYIGVVGPVRTGKSTFIKRFMDTIVLPNIETVDKRKRANDELPQSAAGRTIMTTEPKFIPEEAVEIALSDNAVFRVRMIDCVGYIVDSALGYIEDESPRMVKTPWFDEEIPFNTAAEVGTRKVITDHSTIGLVITTDGSISDIPRSDYVESETRVINELKEINKPFIILLNSVEPKAKSTMALADELSRKHQVPVIPVSCVDLDENEIKRILVQVLFEFPIKEIKVNIPGWMVALESDNQYKKDIFSTIKTTAEKITKIREIQAAVSEMEKNPLITNVNITSLDLGIGRGSINISIENSLFFKTMSEKTGMNIPDEKSLLDCVCRLCAKQKEFDKIAQAYKQVQDTGYGIVMPTMEELTLEEFVRVPLVLRERGSGTLDAIEMVLAEQGLKLSSLNVRMHLGSTEGIKSFLRCSNCMGIVSICALERELKEGDFQVIDIEGLQFKRHFCFVSAQGQESDTVLNFMRFVRHFLSGK